MIGLRENVINIGKLTIPYDIKYSHRSDRIKVVIDINGMRITVPKNYNINNLNGVLDKKSKWIYEHYNELQLMKKEKYARNWESGERILYKGRRYNLRIFEYDIDSVLINFDGKKFIISVPKDCDKKLIEAKFKLWYKEKARKCIQERVDHYSKIMNLDYNRLTIKEQKTRWGSCSKKSNLNFNWKLIMAPQSVIDYVIIHELAHLIHMNHSKDYWQAVSLYYPNYKDSVTWLKKNGMSLSL